MTRYVTGASLTDVKETADHACRKVNAPAYRLSDSHTERVEEHWDDV